MKKDLIGTTTYTVYSNEANAQAEMPVWQVVNCLLDAASRHAEQHGFGYQALKSNNEIWVLARLVF